MAGLQVRSIVGAHIIATAVAVIMLIASFGTSLLLAQPVPAANSPSTPANAAGNQQRSESSIVVTPPSKETKEIKETKETKEVKDNPEWFVGLANAFAALMSAFAWPLVLLGIIIMLSRRLSLRDVKELFGVASPVLSKVKVGGVELELNLDALRQRGAQTAESFDDLVKRADKEYQIAASQQDIARHLVMVMRDALPRVLKKNKLDSNPPGVRSTIYVPDIVFKDYLYQLTDYFPDRDVGGPSGRRFSQRFGIIGRAWRSNSSMGRGNALSTTENAIADLIERWGMTYEEATKSSRANPADICVILRNEDEGNIQTGLLFIDSTYENAFGANAESTLEMAAARKIVEDLENTDEMKALAGAVARAVIPLRTGAPNLSMARSLK